MIGVGDRIVFLRAEDQRRVSITLKEGPGDPERGHISVDSPLGRALLGAEEGDEVEYFDGRQHKISIESTNKGSPAPNAPAVPNSGPALVTSAA